jgi:hypothetical protein
MPLRIKKYDQFDMTVFKASGAVTSEEITDALKCFYEETDANPTKFALWDMRGASLEALDHWEAMWITQVVEYIGHGRDNGKTAIVAADDHDFEISRVIATCVPINLVIARACRTIGEAAEWFRMDAEQVNNLTDF